MPIFGQVAVYSSGHIFARARGFPYYTLSCVLRGQMRISAADQDIDPKPPFVLLIEPDTPYRVEVFGQPPHRETYLIFSPRAGWGAYLDWPEHVSGVRSLLLDLPADGPIVEAIDDAAYTLRSARPVREALAYNALERALLLAHERNPDAKHTQLDARVQAAIDQMTEHFHEPLNVETLAEAVHMSASRFAHLFREQTGEPPMRYLERLRMTRAQQLLISTAQPVAEVAQAVGFDNPYHFSTRFRKCVGRSPRAYRQHPERR